MTNRTVLGTALAFAGVMCVLATPRAQRSVTPGWDGRAAAASLDSRLTWWTKWPSAARDHDTFCISCHTALPYALARPALRTMLHETGPSQPEQALLDNVTKRVRMWREVEPFYPDQRNGLPKTSESRGTESILNALVLATRDSSAGTLSDDGRAAFANMWALQMRTGDLSGAWPWLNFKYEPWEAPASPSFGAALAALAVGTAPADYASSQNIQDNVRMLRGYVAKHFDQEHLFNRAMLVWASTRLSGLVTPEQRAATVAELVGNQHPDGGWATASLGPWQRVDGTPLDRASDGYATGLASLVLEQTGDAAALPNLRRGLDWLASHQDPKTGRWMAVSLNKNRDPASDAGQFMSDAATAYAVLALSGDRKAMTP